MKFEVIVPVLFSHNFANFFNSILSNDILPTRLIVIDNTDGSSEFIPSTDKFIVDVYRSKTKQVNESWNLGLKRVSKDADYIGIYNDDIILNKRFFRRIIETLDHPCRANIGVACPNTVPVNKDYIQPKYGKFSPLWIRKREGWCFTIKKIARRFIPLIPCHLIYQFHGDDWIWYHTKVNGFSWFKDLGNNIWHIGGDSISKVNGNIDRRVERNNWRMIHDYLDSRQFDKIEKMKRIE